MKIFNNIPKFGIALTLITAPFLSNAANQLEKEPTQDVYFFFSLLVLMESLIGVPINPNASLSLFSI